MSEQQGGTHVLVVDDDPLIRLTVEAALSSHGYRVTATGDPRAASGAPEADVVLLDAIMPDCSLSECLTLLGRRLDGSARPILVMSGSLAPPTELAGTGIGYLTKPFPLTELLGAVDGLVASTSGTVT